MEDVLPSFLSIGVTYERFMDSCPYELKPFEKAYKQELKSQNTMMHLQGLYVRDAIQSSIGNSRWFKAKGQENYKYPEKPYDLFQNEETTDDDKKRDLDAFIAQENIRRANWRMIHARRDQEGQ